MNKLSLVVATATILFSTSPCWAEHDDVNCDSAGGKWMTKQAAKEKITALGYETRKVKTEDGCYEVYALKDGDRFEIFLHPVTGKIVKTKKKS